MPGECEDAFIFSFNSFWLYSDVSGVDCIHIFLAGAYWAYLGFPCDVRYPLLLGYVYETTIPTPPSPSHSSAPWNRIVISGYTVF